MPPKVRSKRACGPCRQKKIKCDGKYPCGVCQRRDTLCLLEENEKHRKRRATSPPLESETAAKMPKSSDHDRDHDPTDYEFHCSLTGFDSSASSKMQLYYGPSSAFAFLQQLHVFLSGYASVKEVVKSSRGATYTAEAIAEFGYDKLFFGTHSSAADNMAHQLGGIPTLALSPRLLPWDTASMFLDMYMKSTYYVLPICEESTLRRLLSETYANCTTFCQTPDSMFITSVLPLEQR